MEQICNRKSWKKFAIKEAGKEKEKGREGKNGAGQRDYLEVILGLIVDGEITF